MLTFFVRRLRGHERGFTLIELLIVIAIIAILAAVLIPNFLRSRAQAAVAASKSNMKNIATALESYIAEKGTYPDAIYATSTDGDTTPATAFAPFMRSVPVIPVPAKKQYIYNLNTDKSKYTLCDGETPKLIGAAGTFIVYDPEKGLLDGQTTCPSP